MRIAMIAARNAAVVFFVGMLASCGGGGGGGGPSPSAGGGSAGAGGTPTPVAPLEIVQSLNVSNGYQAVDPRATFQIMTTTPLAASFSADQVQLSDGVTNYPVKIATVFSTLTVTPLAYLHTNTSYRLTIKAGATATDGGVLKNDYVLTFKTLLAVYENKQLTAPDRSVLGYNLPRVQIADINGDGRPDLVELAALYRPDLFGANGYTVNIYLQNAAGGFDKFQKLEYVADQSGYSKYFPNLIVLDVDGDNKPELLVPEFRPGEEASAGIRIFKAGADGKFAAHDFIATYYSANVQAFDVDGDGKTDLVGINAQAIDQANGGIQVLLGTATGFNKLAPVPLPVGKYELGVADLDQDGKPEMLVLHEFNNPTTFKPTSELLVYSQGAPGVFSPNAALTKEAVGFCTDADYCREMKIADLNGDGRPDLVFAAQSTANIGENLVLAFSRLPGGPLVKVSHFSIAYNAGVFAIKDMDGDGIPDFVVIAADPTRFEYFFTIIGGGPNFSLVFSNRITVPVTDQMYPQNVAVGDIDGDGQPDIIFDSYNAGIMMARHVKY